LARPQSTAYRLHKALRRHRAAFAAAAAILFAVVAGSTVSVWQALRATSAERVSEQRRKNEEMLRHTAEGERERALESRARAELNEYVADINLAHQSILAGNLARATELLAKHRETGSQRFEWRYLWQAAQGDAHRLFAQEASSVLSLANSREWLVAGLQDSVRVYDSRSGSLVKTLAKSGSLVALSTAGLLATAGKSSVRVWRISDWAEAYSVPEHKAPVAFSHDGRYLAATSPKGVHVYSGSDGTLVAEIPNSMPPFAFSPRGNVMAVDSGQGIVLWDLDAAKALRVLENSQGTFDAPQVRDMKILVFSPDGHSIVAARNTLRDGSIFALEVWAFATGEKVATMPVQRNLTEHSGMISALAFAPGGRLLASGSRDHSVRLWDFSTLQCVERLHGNSSEVWTLAFAADGQGIISGAKDGTIRLWPTNAATRETFYEGNWMPIKFSQDGRMLAAITDQSRFVQLNLRTAEPEDSLTLGKLPLSLWAGAVSDDFRVLVHPLPEGGLRVWDLQSRTSVDLGSHEILRSWAAISPD
jgi:WD40 repeat protein